MADEEKKDAQAPQERGAKEVEGKEEKSSGGNPWIPLAVALLLFPAISYALIEFVFLPKMTHLLEGATGGASTAYTEEGHEEIAEGGHGTAEAAGEDLIEYKFENVVANLSGSMQSRYLKVSFTIEGDDPAFIEKIEGGKARLTDNTLSLLSSMSLDDLEKPGAKNLIRSDLINAFNNSLKGKVVKQLYFYEFIVQ